MNKKSWKIIEAKEPFAMRVYEWDGHYVILRYPNLQKKEYFYHVHCSTTYSKLSSKSIHIDYQSAENEIKIIIQEIETYHNKKIFYENIKNAIQKILIFFRSFFVC